MAEEQAAHHLLNVLEERGLDVDLDKILLGFEHSETKHQVAAWVDEYLHEDTLLTREELKLYQTLRKKGVLHQYESEGELVRPILDHEIVSAVDFLQSSTNAIEEQCKVLAAQKDALLRLNVLDKPNLDVERARNERRRKEGQEKVRLDVSVDDLATSLTEQLTDAQRDIDTEKSTLKTYLIERFASDDQILSRLPSIVSKIVTEAKVGEDEKSIEQWYQAVISFRTTEIKARVDTVYLNSLVSQSSTRRLDEPDANLKERKMALQSEMEELHSEIASIAEMVVEHEIRKPMTEMRDRNNRERTQTRIAWLNYVLSTLHFMGKRLDTVNISMQDTGEFHKAISHIKEVATKRTGDSHAVRPSPVRRRTTSGPTSAFASMVKLKPARLLDVPAAVRDALRHASISCNHDSIEGLQDSLVQAHLERSSKLQDHYESSGISIHRRLAERSNKADGEQKVILNALYKHSRFHKVNLANTKLEGQLQLTERKLEEKESELLAAESNELSLGDARVGAFIAKYGK